MFGERRDLCCWLGWGYALLEVVLLVGPLHDEGSVLDQILLDLVSLGVSSHLL